MAEIKFLKKEFGSKNFKSLRFVVRLVMGTLFNYLFWVNLSLLGRVYLMTNKPAALWTCVTSDHGDFVLEPII